MSVVMKPGLLFARLATEVGDFFAWWMQELRDTRTALMERFAPRRSQRYILELSDEFGVLSRVGAPPQDAARFSFEQGHLPSLQEIQSGAPGKARLEIALPEKAVLRFEVRLPPLGESEVAGAVALQLERELPLPAEQLFIDWYVAEKAPDRSRVIAVALARQAQVHHWRDEVRSWGWRVDRIGCRGDDRPVRFNLLPRLVPRLSFAVGRRERLMAAGALVLGLAYAMTVGGQWIYERTALAARIAQAREQLAKVEELQGALDRESRPIAKLRELMQTAPTGDAIMAISSAVPKDSWLYQIDIRALAAPVTIGLEGYTPTAASLVQALEQSQRFEALQLLEVANSEAGEQRDRIKIKAHLFSARAP